MRPPSSFFPPPSKWRNSSDFRETNSTDGKFQIQYLLLSPSPRSCSRVTVSLWFSWNLNGVSRERWNIRRSKRSPLRTPSPPITVPIKGGGIEPPPFFLFSSFFLLRGWVDRCKGRRREGAARYAFADVIFNQRDPFSPATRLADWGREGRGNTSI